MASLAEAAYQEAAGLPDEALAEVLVMAIRMLEARGLATADDYKTLEQLGFQRTKMDTAIQMFKFENKQEIRVVEGSDGEPWFVAKDVCGALGLGNISQALSRLDDDEKNSIILNDGTPGTPIRAIISESGMYSLISRSDKPEAKRFKRWVNHEVLPALRKHGSYVVPGREPSAIELFEQMLMAYKQLHSRVDELSYDVGEVRRDVDEMKVAQGQAEAPQLPAQASDTNYWTVVGYASRRGIRITNETAKGYGRRAGQWSRANGYPIGKAPDTRFGQVNTYYIDALDWAFGAGSEQ